MFFAVQLTDTWLISATAKRIYIASALLTVFFLGVLLAISFGSFAAGGSLRQSPTAVLLLKLMLFPGILGTAVLWVAMWYYLLLFHPPDSTAKPLWAAALWLLGPVGSLLYFAFHYLRSPLLQTTPR